MIRALCLWLLLCAAAVASPAACRVNCDDGGGTHSLGSGVLIEYEGAQYVLTNCHVVADRAANDSVTVSWPSAGITRRALVLKCEKGPDADTAVLAVSGGSVPIRPHAIASQYEGGPVDIFGFGPSGQFATARVNVHAGGNWSILSSGVRQGDSGSPVIDARGRVVGLVWGSTAGETYAVRCAPIRRILAAVHNGLARIILPQQYRQCPPGGCPPVYQGPRVIVGGMRPVQQAPPTEPAPVPRDPVPETPVHGDCEDCPTCSGLAEELAKLGKRCDGLDGDIDELAELVDGGFASIDQRFTSLELTIANVGNCENTDAINALADRVAGLEGKLGEWKPADPEPVHYVVVADRGADYWSRVADELTRAKEAFNGIRLVDPPSQPVGRLPRLVAYRGLSPLGNVGGPREVGEALRDISEGRSPNLY